MLARVAVGVPCNLFRRSLGDHQTTPLAALWSEVKHPIGALDHIEMVFDDDDRVAVAPETEQNLDELVNISQSETCGWLIEDVDGVLPRRPVEFGSSLTR